MECEQLRKCAVVSVTGVEKDNHALIGSRRVPQVVLLHQSDHGEQIIIQVVVPAVVVRSGD